MDIDTLIDVGTQLAITLTVAIFGMFVVRFVKQRILKRTQSAAKMSEEHKRQVQTVAQVVSWLANVLIAVTALTMVLGHFMDITPLVTGLGIAGLALSLGSQSLIKDLIGGLTILIENQYVIGDVIKAGDISGVVERLTLRATSVRDINGTLHLVPNGDMRTVSNVTRDWSRALVDIRVAYEENLDRVLGVLEQVAQQFAAEPGFASQLLEPPRIIGPLSLGDWAVTVRVMVKTQPGKQWGVATELRKRLLIACAREHITLPYPRQEVLVQNQSASQ